MTQPLIQTVLEARAFHRADIDVEVTLGSDHNFYVGFSENISEGGLFVATHSLREVGSTLEIDFTLPGHEAPIHVTTVVRWVRLYSETSDAPPGMGLEFVGIAPEAVEKIRSFVVSRSPLFFD